jgi:hypothetical protein
MWVLSSLSGAKRINMIPSTCIALAFLLERAASDVERDGRGGRMAQRLREQAAVWRQTAQERV